MKPLALIVTDTHLKESNTELVEKIWLQAISKCSELKIDRIFFAGDFFDSRKGQPLSVLKSAQDILEALETSKIFTIAIPGNHDKSSYESLDSYLDVFDSDLFSVCREVFNIEIFSLNIIFMPFFKEGSEIFNEQLSKAKGLVDKSMKNILITHFGINGSITNDNQMIEGSVSSSELSCFDSVLVGHFHNRHSFENIHYIGSAYQANYGEDDNKGFAVLFEDGSIEYTQTEFPKYVKRIIDIDSLNAEDLLSLKSDVDNVRIELTGELEKLKSFDKSIIEDMGFQAVLKPTETTISEEMTSNITHDKETLTEAFKKFCQENKVEDIQYGLDKMKNI